MGNVVDWLVAVSGFRQLRGDLGPGLGFTFGGPKVGRWCLEVSGRFRKGGGGETELNGRLNDNSCSSQINERVLRSCVCPDEWGTSIETLGGTYLG